MSESQVRSELRSATQAMVKRFIGTLHTRKLKEQGFQRSGHSFTRAHPDYTERVQIQGSSWNVQQSTPIILRPQEPSWAFFVNVAVRLSDMPVTHGQFHAECRIERLVEASEAIYRLTESVFECLVDRIAEHIDIASAQLPGRLADIRGSAAKGLYSALLPSQ